MPELPTGTVTFLFTDIEGSTRLWEQHPEAMRLALARHDALLRQAIENHGGHVFKTMGDQFCAAFAAAPNALGAALEAQRALQAEGWGEVRQVRVRMALHTGGAEVREGDYFGRPLNRVARLLGSGHGGQILLSHASYDLARDCLPEGVSLRDLGECRLPDLTHSEPVFQLVCPDLPAEFPPLQSLAACPHNLPVQLTSFVGREQEMAEIKRWLSTAHLLTLTGAGGTGKTRLALQVAAEILSEYADGVWLVELASLADPGLVPQTVAAVLGVREEPGRALTQTLAEELKRKQLLLLLDNCEHLLAAGAALAGALLTTCPNLRILATSREGLGIAGETAYPVRSLACPDPCDLPPIERLGQYEAVQLFIDRAVAAAPGFAFEDQNAAAVAQICARLDGIPLALELAAARIKALTPGQIAARLDDRFRLLSGGSRTALPRQQTLRALIDWSYDLLSEAERTVLRRLSVFAGGWTLEAAEAVCSDFGFAILDFGLGTDPTAIRNPKSQIRNEDVLDLQSQLVEKSLVLCEEGGSEPRYRMLETVRQYARDRLLESGEASCVRIRQMEYYGQLAEEVGRKIWTAQESQLRSRLLPEFDNLRTARDWAAAETTRSDTRLWVTTCLSWLWYGRGYLCEDHEQLEEALAMGQSAPVEARVNALLVAALSAYHLGDYRRMQSRLAESQLLLREAGLPRQVAMSLAWLGLHALVAGDTDETARLLSEALAIARVESEEWVTAFTLYLSSLLAFHTGDYRRSRADAEECLGYYRKIHDPTFMSYSIVQAANAAQEEGDLERAQVLYAEELPHSLKDGHKLILDRALEGLAWLQSKRGKWEVSAHLLGAASALRDGLNVPLQPWHRRVHEQVAAACRSALGDETFQALFAKGRAMPLETAVQYGLKGSADA
jgi:predicted ATPase/class 3 adenylate cyclase